MNRRFFLKMLAAVPFLSGLAKYLVDYETPQVWGRTAATLDLRRLLTIYQATDCRHEKLKVEDLSWKHRMLGPAELVYDFRVTLGPTTETWTVLTLNRDNSVARSQIDPRAKADIFGELIAMGFERIS